jgi:hypothetical protein
MGADMCLSWIVKLRNIDDAEKKMIEKIDSYLEKEHDWDELFDQYEMLYDTYKENKEDFKKEIIKIINEFMQYEGRRDSTTISLIRGTNIELIISGGMSWGDTPTDFMTTIEKFACFPEGIVHAGGFGYLRDLELTDIFLDIYKNKLPVDLRKKIEAWKVARKI